MCVCTGCKNKRLHGACRAGVAAAVECAGRATQLLHHTCHFFGGLSLSGEHLCSATRDHVGDYSSRRKLLSSSHYDAKEVCREHSECLGSGDSLLGARQSCSVALCLGYAGVRVSGRREWEGRGKKS